MSYQISLWEEGDVGRMSIGAEGVEVRWRTGGRGGRGGRKMGIYKKMSRVQL